MNSCLNASPNGQIGFWTHARSPQIQSLAWVWCVCFGDHFYHASIKQLYSVFPWLRYDESRILILPIFLNKITLITTTSHFCLSSRINPVVDQCSSFCFASIFCWKHSLFQIILDTILVMLIPDPAVVKVTATWKRETKGRFFSGDRQRPILATRFSVIQLFRSQ